MLGKLIKHEWKSVYKIGAVLLITLLSVTLIGCLYFNSPMWTNLFNNSANLDDLAALTGTFMGIGSLVVCIFMVIGVYYGMMIYLGVRFFRSMYTDEGYLSHTLPVTPHQLLGSKLLVGGLWMLIVNVVAVISIAMLIFTMLASIVNGVQLDVSLWDILREVGGEIVSLYETELGINLTHYVVVWILTVIIGAFSSIMMIFGALTIGQLSKKYKAMMGILTYFGLGLVNMIVGMVVGTISMATTITRGMNGDVMMGTTYDYSLIISIVMGVGLYFLSYFIIKKKLNLD